MQQKRSQPQQDLYGGQRVLNNAHVTTEGDKRGQHDQKETSPAVKHVTPPDPRSLPKPSNFLANKGRGRGRGARPRAEEPAAFDMNQLWQSLQQNPAPIQEELMSSGMGRGTPLNPSVQQFFAQHQYAQRPQRPQWPRPPPPSFSSIPDQFHPTTHPEIHHAPVTVPLHPPPYRPPPASGSGGQQQSSSTNFVPLQVSIKHSKRGGRHGDPPQGEPPRGPVNYPTPQTHNTEMQPPPRGRGHSDKSKAKLAANFSK